MWIHCADKCDLIQLFYTGHMELIVLFEQHPVKLALLITL